jgi:hypothetical protein
MTDGIIEVPKPWSSWVWDKQTNSWVAPDNKAVPANGKPHMWDDEKQEWYEVEFPPATEIMP